MLMEPEWLFLFYYPLTCAGSRRWRSHETYVLSFRFALLILLFSNVARYHATGAKAPTRAAVHKLVRSKQDIGATKNITTMTA